MGRGTGPGHWHTYAVLPVTYSERAVLQPHVPSPQLRCAVPAKIPVAHASACLAARTHVRGRRYAIVVATRCCCALCAGQLGRHVVVLCGFLSGVSGSVLCMLSVDATWHAARLRRALQRPWRPCMPRPPAAAAPSRESEHRGTRCCMCVQCCWCSRRRSWRACAACGGGGSCGARRSRSTRSPCSPPMCPPGASRCSARTLPPSTRPGSCSPLPHSVAAATETRTPGSLRRNRSGYRCAARCVCCVLLRMWGGQTPRWRYRCLHDVSEESTRSRTTRRAKAAQQTSILQCSFLLACHGVLWHSERSLPCRQLCCCAAG